VNNPAIHPAATCQTGQDAGLLAGRNASLGFLVVAWCIFVTGIVFTFAASASSTVFFLLGVIFSGALMMMMVFTSRPAEMILLASLFCVIFNATYHPTFGFFLALQGEAAAVLKFALGVRSAWYAAALLLICWTLGRKNATAQFRSMALVVMLCLGFVALAAAVSRAPFDARVTYALNSFIPTFATVFCMGCICTFPALSGRDSNFILRLILIATGLAFFYFLLLPDTYDTFRPDLASFLRSRPGEYIARGEYDPSWGTRIYGHELNRFVGSFPDPIIAGYFLASMCFVVLIGRKRAMSAWLLFLLAISMSKGAWLFLAQACILYFCALKSRRLLLPATILLACVQIAAASVFDASNRMHLLGLQGGLLSLIHGGPVALVMGYGVGEGGNLARAYVAGGAWGAGWLASGSESGVGVFAHQLGLVGVALMGLLLLRFFGVTSSELARFDRQQYPKAGRSIIAIEALLMSLMINSLLQENCINASVLSSVLLGAVLLRSVASQSAAALETGAPQGTR
jgi:hypothetical protein